MNHLDIYHAVDKIINYKSISITFIYISQDRSKSGTFKSSIKSKSCKFITHDIDLLDLGIDSIKEEEKTNIYKHLHTYIQDTIKSFSDNIYKYRISHYIYYITLTSPKIKYEIESLVYRINTDLNKYQNKPFKFNRIVNDYLNNYNEDAYN